MVDDDQPHPDDDVLKPLLAGEPAADDAERARRAPYERIIERIAALPPIEPPADSWQDLADRATRAGIIERPRAKPWKPAIAALALAAAAAVLLWVWSREPARPRPPVEDLPAVAMELERNGEPVRASAAAIGDIMRWGVNLADPVVEVRIYRDEETLVLRCPGDDGCPPVQPAPPRMQGRLLLDRAGSYRVIAIGGAKAPPPPTGSYHADTAGLIGFTVDNDKLVEVR